MELARVVLAVLCASTLAVDYVLGPRGPRRARAAAARSSRSRPVCSAPPRACPLEQSGWVAPAFFALDVTYPLAGWFLIRHVLGPSP